MKILVIGPSWVGDVMMSQSLYRLLVQRHPELKIDVIAPAYCCPLLEQMPEVNRVILLPIGHGYLALRERIKLGQALKKNRYRQALILPNSFKSALVPFFAGICRRTGWRGEMRYGLLNDIRTLDKKYFPLMVHRYAALAFDSNVVQSANDLPSPLPWPYLTADIHEIDEALNFFLPDLKRPLIGFCPGAAFGPAKRWPHYHYASLAEELIHCGYQIVLFGSTINHDIGKKISSALPANDHCYCSNLVGKTTLTQAIHLIAACQCIVSNDSGLMHIASALDRPIIALYGPSSPYVTPPLSHKAKVIRLINGYHPIRQGDDKQGYHHSLISIKPSKVLDEIETLLSQQEDN